MHRVGNPVAAAPLTHVEAELHGSFLLLPLRPRNEHTDTEEDRRSDAQRPAAERRDARRRPPQLQ